MTDFTISSQVSWVDHYKEQKLYFSRAVENVRIHSGDGFMFVLPTHALLASSKLVQMIFPYPCGEKDQDILLPSVSGEILLSLVELLRCGTTTITGSIGSMNMDRIKEIQGVMEMLSIEGLVTIMKNTVSSRSSKLGQVKSKKKIFDSNVQHYSCNVQVVKMKKMAEVSPRSEQSPDDYLIDADHDLDEDDKDVFGYASEVCCEKKMIQYECNVCKKNFSKKRSWKVHMRNCHQDALFPCADCGKRFILEHTMKLHVETVHMGSAKCDYCQKGYRNAASLSEHIRRLHRDEMIPCTGCNFLFLNEDNLAHHMKKFHPQMDVAGHFVCEVCHATFKKKSYLRRHITKVHSGIRFTCPECRSSFSTKQNLARHVKSVHVHEHKCPEAMGIIESYEHNGNMTNDVTTEVENSDEDNNTIIKQESNIAETQ